MAAQLTPKRVRLAIGLLFAVFLIVNVIIQTMGIVSNLKSGQAFFLLPGDVSMGIRIILFLIGVGISWLLARQIYSFMLKGEISVNESANTAFTVLFCIALTITTFAFLGALAWFWLPVLLLILFMYTMFILWRLLGALKTLFIILLTVVAGVGTFLFTSYLI